MLKKADVDMSKRAGELTDEEVCCAVVIEICVAKYLMAALDRTCGDDIAESSPVQDP